MNDISNEIECKTAQFYTNGSRMICKKMKKGKDISSVSVGKVGKTYLVKSKSNLAVDRFVKRENKTVKIGNPITNKGILSRLFARFAAKYGKLMSKDER